MANTKKKNTGLGAASYFSDVPSMDDVQEREEEKQPQLPAMPEPQQETVPENKTATTKKIRRTFALSPHSQIVLETIKLQGRINGKWVTLSDLLDEAVQLLAKERGVEWPK